MGTCTVHSWNDGMAEDDSFDGKGARVNAQLQPDDESTANDDTDARIRSARRRRAV